MFQIRIESVILVCREIHLITLKGIPTKDGPQTSVLIIRNIPFHLRGSAIDSLLAQNVENFHLMTGVMVNSPLEMSFSKEGPMIIFIQDPLLILILMKGVTLLPLLKNFVGHTHLDLHFCHFPLVVQNLMRGAILLKWAPLGHQCPPSISQKSRLYQQRRYLTYQGERSGQVM